MLTNDELFSLVNDTEKRDEWRIEALDKLIANLALDHLYKIIRNTDRKDSLRKRALDAICFVATLRGPALSVTSISIEVGDASIAVSSSALSLNLPRVAGRAAEILYEMVNDTDRKDEWRYQCLQYLIKIGHKDYLMRIANNTDRKDSWRDEAMRALIHG